MELWMLVEQTLFGKQDKIAGALERIHAFASAAEKIAGGYTVCVSGGKDSSIITELCLMAGVPCTFAHAHTSIDHPQTVYFIREEAERLRRLGYTFTIEIPRTREGKQKTMWNLVAKYGFPTRIQRYCCAQLKEFVGKGKYVITGVRWAESVQRRKQRGVHEVLTARMADKIILNNDNDMKRKFTEICTGQQKYVLNPIVDWSDDEVWEFITQRNIPVNPLYAQGSKRVGCIGCPLNRKSVQDLETLPRYKAAYIRAGEKYLEKKKAEGNPAIWKSAEDYYNWWKYEIDREPSLFEETGTGVRR
jgi:phosphoadenosine phosphosulfate reductase